MKKKERTVDEGVPGNLLNGNKVPATHISDAKPLEEGTIIEKTVRMEREIRSFSYKRR
jgi:hypothetical protein